MELGQDGTIIPPDGTDDSGALSTEGQTEPTMAEVLRALKDTDAQLRTVHGEFRSTTSKLERDNAELRGRLESVLQTGQQRYSNGPSIEDYARQIGLDPDDPSHLAIARRDMQREQEMAEIRGQFQTTRISEQERQTREYTTNELREYAADLGVDFATINQAIGQLPTGQMWAEGKKIVRTGKGKTTNQDNGNSQQDTQQRVADILHRAGITETGQRVGRGGSPNPRDIIDRAAKGENVSREALKAALDSL